MTSVLRLHSSAPAMVKTTRSVTSALELRRLMLLVVAVAGPVLLASRLTVSVQAVLDEEVLLVVLQATRSAHFGSRAVSSSVSQRLTRHKG